MKEPHTENPSREKKPVVRLLFLGDPRFDRRINSFAHVFSTLGWSVEMICGVPKGTKLDQPTDTSIRIIPIYIRQARGPLRFIEYHRKLSVVVAKAGTCELVIASDLYSLGAASLIKRRPLANVAMYDSREVYTELPSIADRPFVKWLWRLFERSALARMDAIFVTASRDIAAIFATHHFTPRPFLIRNVPERVLKVHADQNIRGRFGILTASTLFVYVGGLQKGRGLLPFINAFKNAGRESHSIIIGEGTERESLEALVAELDLSSRVHFVGAVPSSEVHSILATADVGVSLIESISLSYQYALPSKLFEYMMAGLITLTSPLVHVEELFGHEPWLVTADPENESEIRKAIQKSIEIAREPVIRVRAQELAETIYNFESEIEPLILFLRNRLEPRSQKML